MGYLLLSNPRIFSGAVRVYEGIVKIVVYQFASADSLDLQRQTVISQFYRWDQLVVEGGSTVS